MAVRQRNLVVAADGVSFSSKVGTEYAQISRVDYTPNIGLAGSLTTRTSSTAGVITTTNSPSGNIAVSDLVAVGWRDSSDVFQFMYYATVSGIVGNAITFTGLKTGSTNALPNASSAVVIAKLHSRPLQAPTTAARVAVRPEAAIQVVMAVLVDTTETEAGSPSFTKVIPLSCDGADDAKTIDTTAEWTALNSLTTTVNAVYVSNLSVVSGKIQIVSMYN